MTHRAIVLVGLRGAGKTAVGRALARLIEWSVLDFDELLATAVGMSAGAWLAAVGEAAFRAREEAILLPLLATANATVLATGGGAVTVAAVRRALVDPELFTVWLDAPTAVLVQRAQASSTLRPPLTGHRDAAAEWEHVRAMRCEHYALVSDLVLDTSVAGALECAERIARELRRRA